MTESARLAAYESTGRVGARMPKWTSLPACCTCCARSTSLKLSDYVHATKQPFSTESNLACLLNTVGPVELTDMIETEAFLI